MQSSVVAKGGRTMRGLLTLAALLAIAPVAMAREKIDVITMDNGDRITGEIKSLKQGVLTLSTDNLGTLSIEWSHVARVDTSYVFQLEMANGAILLGSLGGAGDEPALQVGGSDGQVARMSDIVRLTPIEERLLNRFEGSISAGISYSKGSDSRQTNLAFDATYYDDRYQANLSLSSIATDDGSEDDASVRDDLAFTYRRLRANRWYTAGLAEAQRNDELGLDLRVSLGGGIGRFLRQSQRTVLALTGGLLVSREWIAGSADTQSTLEGYMQVGYDYFVYDSPKVNLSSDLTLYPSITEWGRVRSDLDITLKWELVSDLSWTLQFYGSYDNEPQAADGSTSDYGFVTGLGYSF
jgi:hypothetical protein